ncbi:MAG TPA: zinc ABC transporter substrate-binding protein [Clostridiaceae bacterium]
MKKFFYLFIVSIFLTGCNMNGAIQHPSQIKKEKEVSLDIMTTNKQLYYMTKEIVGENHNLDYMFEDTLSQWDYTFTEDSLSNIGKQDLFIYNGAGFEPWIGDFLDKLNKGKVGAIDASRGISLINYSENLKYNSQVFKVNPYYWLDPGDYKVAMSNIKNSIEDKDPHKRSYYEKNFATSLKQIEILDKEMSSYLDKFKEDTFLVVGDNLDYFIKYYGLKTIKIGESKLNQQTELDKIGKKIMEAKKVVLLNSNLVDITTIKPFLTEYNIDQIKINVFNQNISYSEAFMINIEALKDYLDKN